MGEPLTSLAVGLQTVPRVMQQHRDRSRTHAVILPSQLLRQTSSTLAGPAKWGLGIATGRRFQQRLQRRQQSRVGLCQRSSASSRRTHPSRPSRTLRDRLVQFSQPGGDRRARQSRGVGHERHSTPARFPRFCRRPLSSPPLVHFGKQRLVFPLNPCKCLGVFHALSSQILIGFPTPICKGYFCASPKRRPRIFFCG